MISIYFINEEIRFKMTFLKDKIETIKIKIYQVLIDKTEIVEKLLFFQQNIQIICLFQTF